MIDQKEIREILSKHPDNFPALYALAASFLNGRQFAACFAMAERAINSYEKNPGGGDMERYFELKRIHARLLREHLDDILGPASEMLDTCWFPVFKNGRPREIALNLKREHLPMIETALNAPQMKRLRYLNVTINETSAQILEHLTVCDLSSLRMLSMTFKESANLDMILRFFEIMRPQFQSITSLNLHLPAIDDGAARRIRAAFGNLEAFSLESDVRLMTESVCEEIADDPQSKYLVRLGLIGTKIGDNGVFMLLSSQNFDALQVLDLRDGILTNNVARVISAANELPSLRAIDLRFNCLDPAGIAMLKNHTIECNIGFQHMRPADVAG